MASKKRMKDRAQRFAREQFQKPPKDILKWPVPRDVKERAWQIIKLEDAQTTGSFSKTREFLNDYRLQSLRVGRYLTIEEYDQIQKAAARLNGAKDPYEQTYRVTTEFGKRLPDGSWVTVPASEMPTRKLESRGTWELLDFAADSAECFQRIPDGQ